MRILDDLDKRGVHAYAPDWIGFGYSEKPQPRYGFNYTEQEFHTVRMRCCIRVPSNQTRRPHLAAAYSCSPAVKRCWGRVRVWVRVGFTVRVTRL